MSQFHPKPFGKYFLIEKLATGGMAEIYKAKTFGVDGFEKLLAIKRILPHCSTDKEFITMLIDEAKLSVLLSHTNIVQVYDLGKVGDDYFISMEFINGINLREALNRCSEHKEKITEDVVVYIISEICKGLDYAHSKKDNEGTALNIIHRDISPQNILISFEGEVKVVDFGIAKAAMNISHTMAGILKGKISYMSPEQALGKPIDCKTDIFSTGLMLYELIMGQKLFTGDTQFEVLKKIRTTRLTDKSFPSTMPESLKKILAKALAYSIKDRYENAGDFQIDLTRYLYSTYNDFTPRKLAKLMRTIFAQEIENKAARKVEEPSIDSRTRSVLIDSKGQQSIVHRDNEEGGRGGAEKQPTQTFIETFISGKEAVPETTRTGHATAFEPEEIEDEEQTPTPTPTPIPTPQPREPSIGPRLVKPPPERPAARPKAAKPRSKRWLAYPLAAMLLVGAGLGAYFGTDWFKPEPPPPVVKGILQIQSSPDGAEVFIDDAPANLKTPASIPNLEVGKPIEVTLKKPKHKEWVKTVTLVDANPLLLNPTLDVIPVGTIKVATTPPGAKILLDGQDTGKITPFTLEELPLSQTYTLKLELLKHRPVEERITMYSIESIDFNKKLEEIQYGSIRVSTNPSGARVFLNNNDTGLNTPAVIPDLEIGPRYNIRLARAGHKDVFRSIEFGDSKALTVSENLPKIDEKTPEQLAQEKLKLEQEKQKALAEKQRLEQERLKQADAEKLKTPEQKRQAELERQKRAELEKQKQAERDKLSEAERLKQAERDKQRQAELDKLKQPDKQKQAERDRQKQAELDKQKEAEKIPAGESFVAVSSDPRGADVFINGVKRGTAPGKFKVASGTPIEITISKSGASTVTKTVNLRPGETRQLGTVNLGGSAAEGAGIVTVDSNPPGAMVFLDGQAQKSTPVRIKGLRPQSTHTIKVTKDGYKEWTTSFTVGEGGKSFMANLKKM